MAKFTFIDLFAGIGGFRIALQNVGGRCLGFSEIAKDAIEAYCINFDEPKDHNFGDITQIQTLPEHDFMTAGVPCQSWSIAGKKLGFDDDRGQLWNDTIYLLNKVRPKAFIFENVKGLADPRNEKALDYILNRIKEAGYSAFKYLLNAYDYGVPQTRVRIYIVGFKDEKYLKRYHIANPSPGTVQLRDVLDECTLPSDLSRESNTMARWSLSCNEQGFNDYFLFNDIRNGRTTIHSWDIAETTERQKHICYLLLTNRRKSMYGILDGNALSIRHLQGLDPTITPNEINELVEASILKKIAYTYRISDDFEYNSDLTDDEIFLISQNENNILVVDKLKLNREFKIRKIRIVDTLASLEERGIVECSEYRYDFKNTKISTGLNGINRVFLPSSKIYPTMVASDTNDFVSTKFIKAGSIDEWKEKFMTEIFRPGKFRKITKSEACRIQGFPADYVLPKTRARWMHLIGNSVAVPVIQMLAQAIVNTGVFNENDWDGYTPSLSESKLGRLPEKTAAKQLSLDF